MSIQRPLGPIGHCSARLRRALEIEEEAALGCTVRVRQSAADRATDRKVRGNRWSRSADFAVPGAFHTRFVSAGGKVTFHFALQAVSKAGDGGCRITTPEGSKRLANGAPADHDAYIERQNAVELTISPAGFDNYAERPSATEMIDGERAIYTNIAPTAGERQSYWRAVHEHERTPGADRLTLTPESVSRPAWQRLADAPEIPAAIREVAASFATSRTKRKIRTVAIDDMKLDRKAARALVRMIATVLGTAKGKPAVRSSEGRGGRSQYRLTAEFANGLDAAGRRAVAEGFCATMKEAGLMYVAAIHAPDHHNDRRNHHLHVAFHDRPAKQMGDRWDFEIAEPVEGQHKRMRYPHRQNKVGEWSRDPAGGSHRAHGSKTLEDMRTLFADLCNEQLGRLGVARQLHPGDLRSLGCDRAAQKPLGTRAAPLEAAGVPTATGIDNAELLWSALLREAWEVAEQRANIRADLRRRLVEIEREAGSVTRQAQGVEARNLIARLDAAEAVLGRNDAECAEYDVTLAMARARPDKALDTCRRIVAAIDAGRATAAECRVRPAIATRAREAEMFLAGISAIDRNNAPALTVQRAAVAAAQADVDAVAAATVTLFDRRDQTRSVPSTKADGRATLEALFDRIMMQDMPILPPDGAGKGYRVPGITRAEFAAIIAPALAEMAQYRLAALSDLQGKRMVAAAGVVASLGLDGVERAAANGDAGAARTLKHARAYADHPGYRRAFADAEAARPSSRPATSKRSGWSTRMRGQFARLVGQDMPIAPSPPVEPAVTAASATATPRSTREDAINALAAALVTEPALRIIEGEHGLIIDATHAPDWIHSVAAFADSPAVLTAMRQRYRSPWLDIPAVDRGRILTELGAALTAGDRRPLIETEGQWHVELADERLCDIVTRWHGYDGLAAVLVRADRHWRAREAYVDGPTSVVGNGGVVVDRAGRGDRNRDRLPEHVVAGSPVIKPASPFRRGDLGR